MEKGISLIELLVALALFAIISAISIPPMKKLLAKQNVISDVRLLINIINTARNRAITIKEPVKICGTTNNTGCERNWKQLTVFRTSNNEVLHSQRLADNYKLVFWSAFQHKPGLTIMPTGFTNHQNGTLYLCHKYYSELHRAIVVSKSGRIAVNRLSKKLQKKCSD